MIKFKINDRTINYPSQWEDLTFAQYVDLVKYEKENDTIRIVSIFSGLEYDYLKNNTIIGLESLLEAGRFRLKESTFEGYYPQVGKYKFPLNKVEMDKDSPLYKQKIYDIRFDSLGQFEDMRASMKKLDGTIIKLVEAYQRFVSIYLQKVRDGVYDPTKVPELEEEVKLMPACEVMAMGKFFFQRLVSLLIGIPQISQNIPPSQKKSKQDSMTLAPSLASMPK